jgi:hypothetical protein
MRLSVEAGPGISGPKPARGSRVSWEKTLSSGLYLRRNAWVPRSKRASVNSFNSDRNPPSNG